MEARTQSQPQLLRGFHDALEVTLRTLTSGPSALLVESSKWVPALPYITETNRIKLVLSGLQNRTFGPYFAVIDRILISLMIGLCARHCQPSKCILG
jgi:hypothetical protein